MFSAGSGSHDGTNYTQWALNPSAYQNMSNDQVDWAALAQQWIMMKETAPPEQMSQVPPPPNITSGGKKEVIDEGGEAPMDVDNEKDDNDWNADSTNNQDWNWQQQWGWGSNWNGPTAVPPPNAINNSKSALLPTPFSHYSHQNIETNTNLDFQNTPSSDYNSGYWTNNSSGGRNKSMGKQRMPRKGPVQERIETNTEPVTLDAAKRRQLPAWIREGLEKMEREKQKQIEKERERVERENYLSRKKEETEGAIKLLQASGLPEKSKFDSDSEDSNMERGHSSRKSPSPRRRTPPSITEEEKSEQMMLLVRRTMTQVLLQVTSSEIQAICEEELARFRERKTASAKKTAQYGTPGQGSISGSLGLGMYGGESDSSSDESDSDRQQNSVNNDSSDTQLKETIRRRKAEYVKTEREIERRLNRNEDRRNDHKDYNNSDKKSDGGQTPEWPDNGVERDTSQVDAQTHGSGSQKTRRYSQKSSSRTPPRKDKKSTPDSRDSRKHQSKKSKQSSSSRDSESDSDESTNSDTTSSTSSRDVRLKSRHRARSRSIETDRSEKTRKKHHRSRSPSINTDSDDRSHSSRRHYERSDSKRSDRSRRERDSRRSRSRSRHRRSRSRSRDRIHRSKRSRSRSRSSRRSRRSRSRSHDRRGHRSPHGGKRSRR